MRTNTMAVVHFLNALWQSVFTPRRFASSNPLAWKLMERWGWILILVRWGYYSAAFALFRDYETAWRPFAAPPFGLDLQTYARAQAVLAVPFGLMVMAGIAVSVAGFTRLRGRPARWFAVFNRAGLAYFFPFLPLQLADALLIRGVGWRMPFIVPLHTGVLLWEGLALSRLVESGDLRWSAFERTALVVLACIAWIVPCAILWR